MTSPRFIASVLLATFAFATAQAQDAGTTTRAQVKADAASARKAGELPTGDLDRKPDEVNPKRYPAAAAAPASGLTRDQVKAEVKAANRRGDTQVGDLGKTQAEKDPARYAGAPASVPKLHLRKKKAGAAASAASS